MSDDEDAEYGLFMPFVTTISNGGVHDDAAYVAGYEMGNLDATLGVAAALKLLPDTKAIHTENQPQADLLAMKHGYVASFTEMEGMEGFDEWLVVNFEWPLAPDDEDES